MGLYFHDGTKDLISELIISPIGSQRDAAVTDEVLLHEGEEVPHGGVHALRHPGVRQVASVEEAMDARVLILVKQRLENCLKFSVFIKTTVCLFVPSHGQT